MTNKVYPTKRKKQNSECPNCGCQISYHSTFENALSGKFDNPDGGAWSVTSFLPTRKADLISDVAVPGAQALITAVLSLPLSAAAAILFEHEWYYSFSIAALVMGASWIKGIRRLELERGESKEFSYEPADSPEDIEPRSRKEKKISLEIISKDDDFKASMKIIDLPDGVSASEFVQFCRDILSGRTFARKDWVGSGMQFSRDQYDGLMSAMLDAGLIIQVAGKGKVLTPGGKRAIAMMIRQA